MSAGAEAYAPPSLGVEGFVHCTSGIDLLLEVASDYFAALEEGLLALEIDPAKLDRPVVFEAAAPIAGGGTRHLLAEAKFPHVYGPIPWGAVRSVATLRRSGDGFRWPDETRALASFLAAEP